MLNVAPDIASTIETRLILQSMAHRGVVWRFVALDVALTFAILIGYLALLGGLSGIEVKVFAEDILRLLDGDASISGIAASSVLATTFVTSIWIWLHLLSSVILRLNSTLRTFLRYEDRPIESLGFVSMLIVGTLFCILVAA